MGKGYGQWAMGNGQWAMGNGQWDWIVLPLSGPLSPEGRGLG